MHLKSGVFSLDMSILKAIKNTTDTNVIFSYTRQFIPFVYVFTSFPNEQECFSKT